MRPVQSMRELDRLSDRIRQHRQADPSPVLIVEGKDDELVLADHLEGVRIFRSDGRPNAVSATQDLVKWEIEKFACVVDADFEDPREHETRDHLILYERRDLEGMLISLGVLTKVLAHLGSERKLVRAGGAAAAVSMILQIVEPVTALREVNARDHLGIAFDQVDLAKKIDKNSVQLNLSSYCAALAATTSATKQQIQNASTVRATSTLGPRGKDVLVAVGVALRKRLGSHTLAATAEEVLVANLHSSSAYALAKCEWMDNLHRRLST